MKKERDYLTELQEALEKEWERGYWEIIEIDLTPQSHNKIKSQLEQQILAKEDFEINTLFGIPVVVDDTIPKDRLWVIKRKGGEGCTVTQEMENTKMNWKKWIDSQVAVVPFIIYLQSLWDYYSIEQRREILRLIREWLRKK